MLSVLLWEEIGKFVVHFLPSPCLCVDNEEDPKKTAKILQTWRPNQTIRTDTRWPYSSGVTNPIPGTLHPKVEYLLFPKTQQWAHTQTMQASRLGLCNDNPQISNFINLDLLDRDRRWAEHRHRELELSRRGLNQMTVTGPASVEKDLLPYIQSIFLLSEALGKPHSIENVSSTFRDREAYLRFNSKWAETYRAFSKFQNRESYLPSPFPKHSLVNPFYIHQGPLDPDRFLKFMVPISEQQIEEFANIMRSNTPNNPVIQAATEMAIRQVRESREELIFKLENGLVFKSIDESNVSTPRASTSQETTPRAIAPAPMSEDNILPMDISEPSTSTNYNDQQFDTTK